MSDTLPRDLTKQAYVLHEALMAWLRATYPQAAELAVIAACSYEIGRLVSKHTVGQTDAEVSVMLDGVRAVMWDHIAAWRAGLRS